MCKTSPGFREVYTNTREVKEQEPSIENMRPRRNGDATICEEAYRIM
jgi:hypothetical protein